MINLSNSTNAASRVLEYKLARLRDHIRTRMEVADSSTAVELQILLKMIGEFEVVPANWQLKEPLVSSEAYKQYLEKVMLSEKN